MIWRVLTRTSLWLGLCAVPCFAQAQDDPVEESAAASDDAADAASDDDAADVSDDFDDDAAEFSDAMEEPLADVDADAMDEDSETMEQVDADAADDASDQDDPLAGADADTPDGAKPPAAGGAAANAAKKPAKPATPANPIVQALLDSKPTTPAELVRVIHTIVELGQADRALPLLKKLIDAQPDEATLAALAGEYGSAMFIELSQIEELNPDMLKFANSVLAAADKHSRDATRLAELIAQLQDPSKAVRQRSLLQLRGGRSSAVVALVGVLGDSKRKAEHAAVRAALVAMDREALRPLVCVLHNAEPDLAAQAANVLGRLDDPDVSVDLLASAIAVDANADLQASASRALERLVGEVPQRTDSAAKLYHQATVAYHQSQQAAAAREQRVDAWHWNAKEKLPALMSVSRQQAELQRAVELARDARSLLPDSARIRRLYHGLVLEAAVLAFGPGAKLPAGPGSAWAEVEALGEPGVEDLLSHTMASGQVSAATVCASILGEMGTSELLHAREPKPCLLVEATRHADRRLRFAAVEAILKLKPDRPFAGSSYVTEALGYLAASSGAPRALVAGLQTEEARRQAAFLMELGYDAEIAGSARELVRLARTSPDYELVLIETTLAAPASGELLQRLRCDGRTARLPLGLLASTEDLARAQSLARQDPLASAIIRPEDRGAMEFQIQRLLDRGGRRALSLPERMAQTEQALVWLTELSRQESPIFDIRRLEQSVHVALFVEGLNAHATQILGNLGTPTAQTALVDLASEPAQPIEARQAAVSALGASLVDHGTLLTTRQIDRQYERYNQSQEQNAESQRILGSILDLLEARAAAIQAEVDAVSPP